MSVSWYLLALKGLAVVPALLTAIACWLYWKTLARPFVFLITSCVILYVLAAIAAFWLLTDTGVAGPAGHGGDARVIGIGMSASLRAFVGYVGFLVLGLGAVWLLQRFFARA